MLDRQTQPEFHIVSELKLLKPGALGANAGLNIYSFFIDKQDILKVEFILKSGTVYDTNPLVPDMTNNMLNEGTQNRSALQIAEEIDYYGSYLSLNVGRHFSYITLYCLSKYFHKSLPVVYDLLQNANFPETEFEIVAAHQYQNFKISQQKTGDVASDVFYENLFGEKHPYGRKVVEDDFEKLSRQQLLEFHAKRYRDVKPDIIISGKVQKEHTDLLAEYFGSGKAKVHEDSNLEYTNPAVPVTDTIYVPKKDSVQCSINMGQIAIRETHPDFSKLSIATTILGGYFGSRLMTNVREDKGYTYGIYSGISTYKHAGIFGVSAETGIDVAEKAVAEIHKELKIMQTELVGTDELNRVKNYLSAGIARKFDGIFAAASAFKNLLLSGLDYSYYENFFETIKNIQSEDIRNIAQTYFNADQFLTVIVGKEKP